MRCPRSPSTRAAISRAALFVNVIARIANGLTPCSRIRYAIRCVRARVLPDPAPATISTGPSVCRTASACTGFRASTRGERTATALIVGGPRTVSGRTVRRPSGLAPGAQGTRPNLRHFKGWPRPRSSTTAPYPLGRRHAAGRATAAGSCGSRGWSSSRPRSSWPGTCGGTCGGPGSRPSARRTTSAPGSNATWRASTPADAPDRVVNVPGNAVAIIRIPKIDVGLRGGRRHRHRVPEEGPGPLHRHGVPVAGHREGGHRRPPDDVPRALLVPRTSSGRATGSSSRRSTGSSTTGWHARSSRRRPGSCPRETRSCVRRWIRASS